MVVQWLSACVEDIRQELDIEAQLARLSEVNASMQDAADFVGDLINADFDRVQRRLRVATQTAVETHSIASSEVVEVHVEHPVPIPVLPQDPIEDESEFIPMQQASMLPPDPAEVPLAIDYSQPDEPDAEPIPFEEPQQPILPEDVTPDQAFEAYIQYAAELDYLEEKAYQEAVIEQVRLTTTPQERREVVQQALLGEDVDIEEPANLPQSMSVQRFAEVVPLERAGNPATKSLHPTEPMVTEVYQQHVVSDHRVLVTRDADGLQNVPPSGNGHSDDAAYEEHWVVDRESFMAGGNPDNEPDRGGNGHGTPAPAKKFKKPRRRTYFHIQFEHMGEEAPRSRFAEEGRTIYINRDHPQIAHVEESEGVESLAYRSLMNEIVIQEYASAVVKQMASTGFYVADPFDAIETIQAVVNRLALEAGYRMKEEGLPVTEPAVADRPVDDDDF
jgi:hypothetical protein